VGLFLCLPMKIFAFPFAGGDSYCYREFQKKITHIPIITLSLPGRGKRFGDQRLESIDGMADEAIKQFQLTKAQDFVFYGHSMGALIAYVTAIKLRALHLPQPKLLFFSGRKGASLNTGKGNRHKLPTKEFRAELESLGGCPKEVLQNHELMEIFEPILRSDFKAVETYQYITAQPLQQKITLFHGSSDHFTKEEVLTWQQESGQPIEYHEFDGGHFFIQKDCDTICDIMEAQINRL